MTALLPAAGLEGDDHTVDGRDGKIRVRDYVSTLQSGKDLDRGPGAALVWIHGGGFSSGGLDQRESDSVARAIAKTGRFVRTVDYRLVPPPPSGSNTTLTPSENRYPAAVNDIVDSILDLVTPYGTIYLGGASAGACLALTAALRFRDSNPLSPRVHVAGLILAYGTFHAALPELPAWVDGLLGLSADGAEEIVHRMNLNYAGSQAALDDPLVFPGGGNLSRLPPTLLLDAHRDVLRASGSALAKELTLAKVVVDYEVVPDTTHGFLDQPDPTAFNHATTRMANWLSERDIQPRWRARRSVSDGCSPNRSL